MVAPLYIHIVHFHKLVQYYVRTGTSVEYIADNVELVYADRLYQLAQRDYEGLGNACADDSADYLVVVIVLVHVLGNVQELVKYVHHILGDTLPDTRARILCGNGLADKYEPVYAEPLPFVGELAAVGETGYLLFRVVYQLRKLFAVPG